MAHRSTSVSSFNSQALASLPEGEHEDSRSISSEDEHRTPRNRSRSTGADSIGATQLRSLSRPGSFRSRSVSGRSQESFFSAMSGECWEDAEDPTASEERREVRVIHAVFYPGRIGITIDYDTRRVDDVVSGTQADREGIVTGMYIESIEGQQPSVDLMDEYIAGQVSYHVVFKEMPVEQCRSCPSQEPRQLGISSGGCNGFSLVWSQSVALLDALIRAASVLDGEAHCRLSMANSGLNVVMKDPKLKTMARWAAGGLVSGGSVGGVVGTTSGGLIGAAVGLVPALFTFGLSIPVGAVIGGTIGGGAGVCVGGSAGLAGGTVVGGGVANKDELRRWSRNFAERCRGSIRFGQKDTPSPTRSDVQPSTGGHDGADDSI